MCDNTAQQTKVEKMMNRMGTILIGVLICGPGFQAKALSGPGRMPTPAADQGAQQLRDGQHDFDFHIGNWKTHLKRLSHPLTGSTTWVEYDGTTIVSEVWDGRANLVELELDGPTGHIEGLGLRLYNPQAHQWSLNFANSAYGTLGVPTVGEFRNGRGEFYDQETYNGRVILVRNMWTDITADSCHFEQAFSDDGGKTWEVNWIATDTRMTKDSSTGSSTRPTVAEDAGKGPSGQHDFDFELGSWKIHLKKLMHPMTSSTTWVEFDGDSVTHKVWDGRAQLEQFETDGAIGHIEGLTLRLYNPQSQQWSLYWSNSKDGLLVVPQIGEVKNGQGEFYAQDMLDGKSILIRFIWTNMTTSTPHFEQSFSNDGGKTWEVNWVTDQARVAGEPAKM
jgi:hypothetical protein